MGTAGSVENKPQCSYHRMRAARIRKAKNAHYTDGKASEFYCYCSNGDVEQVRRILEDLNEQSIDELVKLEPNGDTALHVAAEKGHVEIVKLLLEHKCPRGILNCHGKFAYEMATEPVVKKLFTRSETSDRFHECDASKTIVHYLPKSNGTNTSLEFFQQFETEADVHEYSLNHQTTAMWLRFYNWFSRNFPRFFQRENLNLNAFELHENNDFTDFLKEKLGDKYKDTIEEFNEAHQQDSIKPLLRIYSDEDCGFYKSLNRQLADTATEANTSPHLCDRFIIEFHIRSDELRKRSYIGTVYRGVTINSAELSLYEKVRQNKPRGIIAFKAFTSTSEEKNIALEFAAGNAPKEHKVSVLFIIEIKTESPTIMGMGEDTEFVDEKEILIMPGNLFIVKKIIKDVDTRLTSETTIPITEIYLEYLHIPVSFRKKLLHTYRSATKSSTT